MSKLQEKSDTEVYTTKFEVLFFFDICQFLHFSYQYNMNSYQNMPAPPPGQHMWPMPPWPGQEPWNHSPAPQTPTSCSTIVSDRN